MQIANLDFLPYKIRHVKSQLRSFHVYIRSDSGAPATQDQSEEPE